MNPWSPAGGGLLSVIMPSYQLYSDTAGAINSGQCLSDGGSGKLRNAGDQPGEEWV